MKNKLISGILLALALAAAGCNATQADVAEARGAALSASPVEGDAPAARQYENVRAAFAAGQAASVQLGAYELMPVGDASARAAERTRALGINAAEAQRAGTTVRMREGDRELSIDTASGAERWVDHGRFHQGAGVAALPLAEADYVSRAREHLKKVMPDVAAMDLRSYKVRRYMNDSASRTGEHTGPTVYQVAVAFTQVVDGMPVIGSGGKVAVHLTPEGEVISHESTVRAVARRTAAVSGRELLAPDVARRQVEERLSQRGVDLSRYTLTRSELGYLRLGRNSVQSVLVPHYAYVYEPASSDVMGKKLVETIPAVTDPAVLERLRADEKVEAARLAERHAQAAPDDVK